VNALHLTAASLIASTCACLLSVIIPARAGRTVGFALLGLSGALALSSGIIGLLQSTVSTISGGPHVVLRIDPLSSVFIGLIGCVAVLVALYNVGAHPLDERRTGRTAASAAAAIFLASILACSAEDVLLFLFAWELLALSFYWAIAFAGTEQDAPQAAYFTLVVTHVAGAALVAALLVLARAGGAYDVARAVAGGAALGAGHDVVLVLLLIGFGAKFGMIPMQAWMPHGYRAAPSGIAALMAGGALNVGFYGLARFMLPLAGPIPEWFAILVLALGAIAALLGIAWGAAERDARMLAAYSSVENGGIILAAFGVALCGRVIHNDLLYGLGVAAALLQIAAHAFSKTSIFLVCSMLRERCHTTSFELLGGLARSMRVTVPVALVAALSLAALPPFAGFASEWLVLESMMQAFRTGRPEIETALAVCGAIIGLAAGIAVVAFVKFVGIGLLGAARSQQAAVAGEEGAAAPRVAMTLCAIVVLALGVLSRQFILFVAPAVAQFGRANAALAIARKPLLLQPAFAGFSSVSPAGLLVMIAGFTLLFWLLTRLVPRPATQRAAVWTSGEVYRPWTQYTGTGFANPTRVILDSITRTVRSLKGDTYESASRPLFDLPWYGRFAEAFLHAADRVRATQSGVIAAYLAYILGFTLLVLLFYPSIRNW
jgi:hydrogenase-4 component B